MSASVMFTAILLLMTISASSMEAVGTQGPGPSPLAPARTGNAEAGKALYTKMTCYYCHGTAGQGGSAGARIAVVQRSPDAFIRYVRRPTATMPAYGERILSDAQLADIYAYLRSLPAARPASEIPLLADLKRQR
jgi:mono/diheme cytochrome c family protein